MAAWRTGAVRWQFGEEWCETLNFGEGEGVRWASGEGGGVRWQLGEERG